MVIINLKKKNWFVKGLAYVDFSDDAHLTAAIEKNRQMLLGKRLSIARSNPNKSKKDNSGRDGQLEHGRLMNLILFFTLCMRGRGCNTLC